MRCEIVRENLIPFLDQALPFTDMARIKQHIKICHECRKAAADIGPKPDLSPLTDSEHTVAFWEEFDRTLFTKIEERKKESKVVRLFSKRGVKIASWAAVIAFAIILPASLLLNRTPNISDMRFPNPADQGVYLKISPVADKTTEKMEFVSPGIENQPTVNKPPFVIENVDYRTESAVGLY